MYCKCRKGDNYQVIGLCDAGAKTITEEASWVQITVPEILQLPECYPDIEEIERIYVNVVIESSRVVETPSTEVPNEECDKITGYKLIVDGSICQTVLYTADNCEQSVHSINFKFPFCTGIVLNEEPIPGQMPLDVNYYVESCIEDVYAKVLNAKTIFKNVTLFLQAIAITGDECCPEEEEG